MLPGQADLLFGYEEILSKVMVEPLILLSSVIQDYAFYKPKTICDIEAKSIFSYNNSFDQLIKDLEHWKKQNYRILLLSSSTTRAKRLAENIGIESHVVYYSARKSFVQHGFELGISLETLEYCIGQSMKKNRPIFNYVKIMRKHADIAIRKILDELK